MEDTVGTVPGDSEEDTEDLCSQSSQGRRSEEIATAFSLSATAVGQRIYLTKFLQHQTKKNSNCNCGPYNISKQG